jgi:CPA2 family monovalent cation:H+ antiporter-2
MRDAFAVMFFLSVGMLLDPQQVLAAPFTVLATLAIVMIGKPVAAILIVALLGYRSRVGLGVAIALAQIGEFSFLLAVVGRDLGLLTNEAMNALVAASIVSIMLNPLLYRTLPSLEGFLRRRPTLFRLLNRTGPDKTMATSWDSEVAHAHHAIVVGYGPIGQTVVRLLREREIEPTIIEMNIETFRRLKANGQRVVYGDAAQKDVLLQAGVNKATSIIMTASGSMDYIEAIREARTINPRIHIVVRAGYLRESEPLLKAGADEVFSGEGEVALAMTDSILRNLGATPDQLDEERSRIREDLQMTVEQ